LATRHRKVRKQRGSRTHGWGQIGQHRKTGAKGGRGMAGGHKHKWTKLLNTDYFGEKGFTPPTATTVKAANLIQVSTIAERTGKDVVNLAELGYGKLIAGGNILKPLTIVVDGWSERAAKKVTAAGGRLVKPGELTTT